jgi:hypothetical protein
MSIAGLVGLATVDLLAQIPQSNDAIFDNSPVRYAVTQGGLLAMLVLGGWMYRRDFISIFNRQQDTIRVMTDTVSRSTEAITNSHAAIDSLGKTVERLTLSTDALRQTMLDAIIGNRSQRHTS